MVQAVLSGLEQGCTYSLVGLALVVVMKATDVPNFAAAEVGLLGVYVAQQVTSSGLSFYLAVAVGITVGVLASLAIDLLVARRIANRGHFPAMLATVGVSIVIGALIELLWGAQARAFNAPWGSRSLSIAGADLSVSQLVAIVLSVIATLGVSLFFRSEVGARMRATAENRANARLLGVNVVGLSALAWALAGAIAAVAMMLQAQSGLVSTGSADAVIVFGLIAATLGGFTSLVGTFVGGLVLGILQNVAGVTISTDWETVLTLAIVLGIVLARPAGFTLGLETRRV
jgi:branched-chain amino acid transport system permease protein